MLALVTCHIFPPSIWYGKKWIPGTWLPGWQLTVFQSPRLHECGPAAMCNPAFFTLGKAPVFLEHHGGDEDQDISDLWNDWNAEVSGTDQSLTTDSIKNDHICSHPGCSPPRGSNIDQSQGLDPGKDFGSYHWEVCGKGSFIVPTIGFQRRLPGKETTQVLAMLVSVHVKKRPKSFWGCSGQVQGARRC